MKVFHNGRWWFWDNVDWWYWCGCQWIKYVTPKEPKTTYHFAYGRVYDNKGNSYRLKAMDYYW
jgi:hypothetical protein